MDPGTVVRYQATSGTLPQQGPNEVLVISGAQFIELNYYNHDGVPSNTQALPLPTRKHLSPCFTGRRDYLERLKLHFIPSVAGQRKAYLLHGLGGIGKTQICLKFWEQHQDFFSDLFWIDASSEENIEYGLKKIADEHRISPEANSSARSTLQWISQRPNWLLVYDGADGHYSVVEKFLPPGSGGNLLITSKDAALKRITLGRNSEEVLEMTNEDAISLLLQSAKLDDRSDHIIQTARKLVSEMGGMPLAIAHAGQYMHVHNCSLDNYLELYTKQRDQILSSTEFQDALGYKMSTYGTWDNLFDKIVKVATTSHPDNREGLAAQSAINILKIFAFLDHDKIPEDLFKNAAKNYAERNVHEVTEMQLPLSIELLDDETLFLNEEKVWDQMHFLSGIHLLLSFSLIKSHNQLYSMHLLVHTWIRSRMKKEEIPSLYLKTRALLTCSVTPNYNADNHEFCRLLATHIRSNSLYASKLNLETTYYDDEYATFSFVFHHVGDWNEREKLLSATVDERKKVLGDNHPDTLSSIGDLASTYNSQGKLDDAEELQMKVIKARSAELGIDHSETLASISNLALTYWKQGRWDEAENLQVQMTKAMEAKLGKNNPNTLTNMANLALTYWNKGKWNEAERLQVKVREAAKKILGANHPHTLTSIANLANTYRNQGKWDEAEKMHVEVMNARKEKLGMDHPDTLTSLTDLASTYCCQGRWEDAEKLQVEVHSTREKRLGSDNLHTLSSVASLALTYLNQGRWNEAEKLQIVVMDARKAQLKPDHPDTLTSLADLASTYWCQGKWADAEKLQLEVMEVREKRLGSDHPDTLTSIDNLASTYWSQGRCDEAEKMQVKVVDTRKEKFGLEHPDTLTSLAHLASTYWIQGKWNKAKELQAKVMSIRKERLGSDHPDTLTSLADLASTCWSQERWDEAEKLQIKVMDIRRERLGSDHPQTLTVMASLALTYWKQKRWDEAQILLSSATSKIQETFGYQHPTTLHFSKHLNDFYEEREVLDIETARELSLHSSQPNMEPSCLSSMEDQTIDTIELNPPSLSPSTNTSWQVDSTLQTSNPTSTPLSSNIEDVQPEQGLNVPKQGPLAKEAHHKLKNKVGRLWQKLKH